MEINKRIIGSAAVIAGLAIVGGALLLSGDDDSSSDAAPASQAATTTAEASASSADPGCTMQVESVVYTLDPLIAQQFAAIGLSFDSIRPGNQVAEGTATAPRIHASRDVSCDLSSGYIGMRGGFRVSRGNDAVEFRRFRVDLDSGQMLAFFKSTGQASFEAVELGNDDAQFSERGALISGVMPMVIDKGSAVALNATLGTELPSEALELGTVTVTGIPASVEAE
jgi:hypothetical protein